jgi:hypothetical protein
LDSDKCSESAEIARPWRGKRTKRCRTVNHSDTFEYGLAVCKQRLAGLKSN